MSRDSPVGNGTASAVVAWSDRAGAVRRGLTAVVRPRNRRHTRGMITSLINQPLPAHRRAGGACHHHGLGFHRVHPAAAAAGEIQPSTAGTAGGATARCGVRAEAGHLPRTHAEGSSRWHRHQHGRQRGPRWLAGDRLPRGSGDSCSCSWRCRSDWAVGIFGWLRLAGRAIQSIRGVLLIEVEVAPDRWVEQSSRRGCATRSSAMDRRSDDGSPRVDAKAPTRAEECGA